MKNEICSNKKACDVLDMICFPPKVECCVQLTHFMTSNIENNHTHTFETGIIKFDNCAQKTVNCRAEALALGRDMGPGAGYRR